MTPYFYVCRHPEQAYWQLGNLSGTPPPVLLLGWKSSIDAIDEGLPSDIREILAKTMLSQASVVCLVPNAVKRTGPGSRIATRQQNRLASGWLGDRVRDALGVGRPDVTVSSPRDWQHLTEILDEGYCAWWLQNQFLALFNLAEPVPDLGADQTDKLLSDNWADAVMDLGAGCAGVIRPGVDGAVAGFVSGQEGFERQFLRALEGVASELGGSVRCVSETELARAIS